MTDFVGLPKEVPSSMYQNGSIPQLLEEFGDGGAVPEIHVAQCPLDIG